MDVTWGLLGEISGVLDVNPAELEGKDALRWDMPAWGRVRWAQRKMQGVDRTSKLLEQLPMFKQAGRCAWVLGLGPGCSLKIA